MTYFNSRDIAAIALSRSLMGSTQLNFLTNSFQHNTPPPTLRFNRIHSPNRSSVVDKKSRGNNRHWTNSHDYKLHIKPSSPNIFRLHSRSLRIRLNIINSRIQHLFQESSQHNNYGNRNLYTFRSRCRIHYRLVFHGWSSAVAVGGCGWLGRIARCGRRNRRNNWSNSRGSFKLPKNYYQRTNDP